MTKPTNTTDGVALAGYDVVSYYTGTPLKGDPAHAADHNGSTYHFASAENLEAFKAAPEDYLPEYGGYCATAMSEGKIFEVDPENFKVTDGDLYLFYKGEAGDTLPEWNADEANRKANADKHWTGDTYVDHD